MADRKLKKYTEEELVAGLKKGEPWAFTYLVKNYSYALRKAIDRPDISNFSDDLLQDTFIKIWENIGSFDEKKGRLFTWMVVIARRLVLTALTSKPHKKAQLTSAIDQYIDVHPYLKNHDNYLDTNDDMVNVEELVQKYAPHHTTIINAYLQGYQYKEIAKQEGLSIKIVRKGMEKSLKSIKAALSSDLFHLGKSPVVRPVKVKREKVQKMPAAPNSAKLNLGKQVKILKEKGHKMKFIAKTFGVCITTCHTALRYLRETEHADIVLPTLEQEKIRLGKKISRLRLKKISIKEISKKLKIGTSTCYGCLRYLDEVNESKKDYGAYLKKMREIAKRVRLSQQQGESTATVAKVMGVHIDTCYNALRMFK